MSESKPGILQRNAAKLLLVAAAAPGCATGPHTGTYRGPDNCPPPSTNIESKIYEEATSSPKLGLAYLRARFQREDFGGQTLDSWLNNAPITQNSLDEFKPTTIIERTQTALDKKDKAVALGTLNELYDKMGTLSQILADYQPIPGKGPDYTEAARLVSELQGQTAALIKGIENPPAKKTGASL